MRVMNQYDDPTNARSDSFDVVLSAIQLDVTQMAFFNLKGVCTHTVEPLITNSNRILFDLAPTLTVDSVKVNGTPRTWQQLGHHVHIFFGVEGQPSETFTVEIGYHGNPPVDNSFGGLYNVSGYVYNLGVGFNADPHNFGRAWYPCFDSFVERASHEVAVLTNNGRTAYCGGLRTSVETVGQDSLRTTWFLQEPIPSYLVSVAVSNYTHVEWEYETAEGNSIPVYLTARPADTTAFKNSMTTLLPWIQQGETLFGPYKWPRVGFVAVPFNGGAMEHATNIAYPLFAIDGTLNYETLMAHELSHHWWGDLVTCSTAEDMWLNEGWASYCEALYIEHQYGREAYIDYVMANHKSVLTSAHISDGGRYPVSGVPHEAVYGAHVYSKGASILHNIRSMMGDEAFFNASRDFLTAYSFQPVSSEDMKNFYQNYTSRDMNLIFEQWVYSPGYPDFRFSEITDANPGTYLEVGQYGHYSDQYYEGFDLPIRVEDYTNTELLIQETSVEVQDDASIVIPIATNPYSNIYTLNAGNTILNAVLPEQRTIYDEGITSFNYAEAQVKVNELNSDSLVVRIENHWGPAAVPNAIPFTDIIVSNDRWWSVQCGQFYTQPDIQLTLRFFGSPTSSTPYDPQFFGNLVNSSFTENDLKVYYRSFENHQWVEWDNYLIESLGSPTNWNGRVQIFNVLPGDYCWGIQTGIINTEEIVPNVHSVSVYTSPDAHLHMISENTKGTFTIYDVLGKQIDAISVQQRHTNLDMNAWAAGTYLVVYSFNDIVKTFHVSKHTR
jgi:aminopeptidase N